jgi:hypothetical protein
VPADGLVVDLGLAAAVDDDDGERRAGDDEPVDQPADRRRERGHHDEYERLDAPERLAHASGDVRLLRFIDEETAARTDQEAVVGLKHIAAFGALEGDFFETIVKPSHDPSSALQPARLLIGRGGAAGGSKERKAESWQARRSLGRLAEPRTSICAWVRAQLSDRLSVRRVSLPPPCGSTITAASSEHERELRRRP